MRKELFFHEEVAHVTSKEFSLFLASSLELKQQVYLRSNSFASSKLLVVQEWVSEMSHHHDNTQPGSLRKPFSSIKTLSCVWEIKISLLVHKRNFLIKTNEQRMSRNEISTFLTRKLIHTIFVVALGSSSPLRPGCTAWIRRLWIVSACEVIIRTKILRKILETRCENEQIFPLCSNRTINWCSSKCFQMKARTFFHFFWASWHRLHFILFSFALFSFASNVCSIFCMLFAFLRLLSFSFSSSPTSSNRLKSSETRRTTNKDIEIVIVEIPCVLCAIEFSRWREVNDDALSYVQFSMWLLNVCYRMPILCLVSVWERLRWSTEHCENSSLESWQCRVFFSHITERIWNPI